MALGAPTYLQATSDTAEYACGPDANALLLRARPDAIALIHHPDPKSADKTYRLVANYLYGLRKFTNISFLRTRLFNLPDAVGWGGWGGFHLIS